MKKKKIYAFVSTKAELSFLEKEYIEIFTGPQNHEHEVSLESLSEDQISEIQNKLINLSNDDAFLEKLSKIKDD